MNKLIREINGFYKKSNFYGDTDSLYIDKIYCDEINKARLFGSNLCQCESNFKSGCIFLWFVFSSQNEILFN